MVLLTGYFFVVIFKKFFNLTYFDTVIKNYQNIKDNISLKRSSS